MPPFSMSKSSKAKWLMTPPTRRNTVLWTLLKKLFILLSFAIAVHLVVSD